MNLDGFVGTGLAQEDTCPGVYAVDTEMVRPLQTLPGAHFPLHPLLPVYDGVRMTCRGLKIGRASCRERV